MLGYLSDPSNIFSSVGAKFSKVLQSHLITIQISLTPISYNNYRKSFKKHLDCEELKDIGQTLEDYSTHSFRLGGNIVHPVFLQKNAHNKQWESTIGYIKPSLPLALRPSVW